MKHLVVLGKSAPEASWLTDWLASVSPRPSFAARDSSESGCDGLLVIDDGSNDGVAAIRSALEIRNQSPGMPIAVLRTIDHRYSDAESVVRSRAYPNDIQLSDLKISGAAFSDLATQPDCLDVRITDDAILFEFNGS